MPQRSDPEQTFGELFELAKTYAVQETVDPIRSLGKFIVYGVAAVLLGVVSLILLGLGTLRFLQAQTGEHLTGHLSWVPYLVVLVLAVVLSVLAAVSISATKGSKR